MIPRLKTAVTLASSIGAAGLLTAGMLLVAPVLSADPGCCEDTPDFPGFKCTLTSWDCGGPVTTCEWTCTPE